MHKSNGLLRQLESRRLWAPFHKDWLLAIREILRPQISAEYAIFVESEAIVVAHEVESCEVFVQYTLQVLRAPENQLVAACELLSPTNKGSHGDAEKRKFGMVQTGGRRALGGRRSPAAPASRKAWVDADGHRTYYTPHDPPFQGGRALSPDVPPVGSPRTVLPRFDPCPISAWFKRVVAEPWVGEGRQRPRRVAKPGWMRTVSALIGPYAG